MFEQLGRRGGFEYQNSSGYSSEQHEAKEIESQEYSQFEDEFSRGMRILSELWKWEHKIVDDDDDLVDFDEGDLY